MNRPVPHYRPRASIRERFSSAVMIWHVRNKRERERETVAKNVTRPELQCDAKSHGAV